VRGLTIKFAPDYKNEQGLGRVIEKTRYQIPQRGICARARPPAVAKALAGRRSILPALSVRSLKGVGGSACATVFSTTSPSSFIPFKISEPFSLERHYGAEETIN